MKRFITALTLTAASAAMAAPAVASENSIFTEREEVRQSTSDLTMGADKMQDRDSLLSAREKARGVEADGVFEVYSEGPGAEFTPFYENKQNPNNHGLIQ